MRKHLYTVDWLGPSDASAIAAVEAKVHAREHHAGEHQIWAQLQEMEQDGRNLSLGLYYRTRLVGFGLGGVMRDRKEMAEFFDAPLPPQLDPNGKTIYVADYVVMPRHRQASRLISAKFASMVLIREDLQHLSIDAFSTEEYATKWRDRGKFIAKLGWRAAGCFPFHDKKLGITLNWLHFERIDSAQSHKESPREALASPVALQTDSGPVTVGRLPSVAAWDQLRPYWNDLVKDSNQSPFTTWEYLKTWHTHFGLIHSPIVAVALRAERPVAAMPLQIAFKPSFGRFTRRAMLPTETNRLRPFSLLCIDQAAAAAVYNYIAIANVPWDTLELCLFDVPTALNDCLRQNHLTFERIGPTLHHIDLRTSSWAQYLQGRPDALQNLLASSKTQLAQRGTLRLELHHIADGLQALDDYLLLEQSAPEDESSLGASVSAQQIAFYRELAEKYGKTLGIFTAFLLLNDKAIAGAIGYVWRQTMHVVHLTRSAEHAPDLAGIAAVGDLIEFCFANKVCETITIPPLSYIDAAAWATGVVPSYTLRVERTGIVGRLRHLANRFRYRKSALGHEANNALESNVELMLNPRNGLDP